MSLSDGLTGASGATGANGANGDELSAAGLIALGPGNACDTEPIHLSGAVQPHGYLLGLDPTGLTIEVASDNLQRWLGVDAEHVLGRAVGDVLGGEVRDRVRESVRRDLLEPEVATVLVPLAPIDVRRQELAVHRSSGLVVCELEPSGSVSDEATVAFYQAVNRALATLDGPGDVRALCETAVAQVRELTGYDRVMIYRFSADAHGEVVAEARHEHAEPFLGLHYPATDIPRQARLLYLRNWVRVIADVRYQPVPLLARPDAVAPEAFDLGLAGLRSVSPMHLQYLANMGVGATLTISLIVDGRLWGMIACHHDSPRTVSGHLRSACATYGQALSVRIRAAEELERHAYAGRLSRCSAQLVRGLAAAESLADGAIAGQDDLLGMVGAQGAVLRVAERSCGVGRLPEAPVLDLVVQALTRRAGARPGPLAVDAVRDLVAAELGDDVWDRCHVDPALVDDAAAGALFLPLGQAPGDHLLWLRSEQARTVRWAGRHDPAKTELTPRASFAEWQEVIRGRSAPWLPVEVDTARELGQAFPELLLHRAQSRLTTRALHDPLTGLPNRALLLERLTATLADAVHEPDRTLAVLFVDLDHFGDVNDHHGHPAGDGLLVSLAARLSGVLRPGDTLARLGGDEFVLLVPSVSGVEQAIGIARRVLEQCRLAFPLSPGATAELSASIGVALQTGPGEAVDVLRRADNALYYAKRAGRDQIRVHGLENAAETEESRLEAELDVALAAAPDDGQGQLVLHYQPVMRLAGNGTTVHGAEALVRWQHPRLGLLSPDRFVPLAEESGRIELLGLRVLDQALATLQGWRGTSLVCAVNVSVAELSRSGYVPSVLQRLAEHEVAPEQLCVEITETQMMQRPERVAAALGDLMAAGVRIAIDDFGTGFSSLAYVRDLPAHLLKIDRSFVAGLPGNPRDVAVVASVVRLAHELGMQTVAEGVETSGQLAVLRELGCDLAQGYLFGRPVPLAELDAVTPRGDSPR